MDSKSFSRECFSSKLFRMLLTIPENIYTVASEVVASPQTLLKMSRGPEVSAPLCDKNSVQATCVLNSFRIESVNPVLNSSPSLLYIVLS